MNTLNPLPLGENTEAAITKYLGRRDNPESRQVVEQIARRVMGLTDSDLSLLSENRKIQILDIIKRLAVITWSWALLYYIGTHLGETNQDAEVALGGLYFGIITLILQAESKKVNDSYKRIFQTEKETWVNLSDNRKIIEAVRKDRSEVRETIWPSQ